MSHGPRLMEFSEEKFTWELGDPLTITENPHRKRAPLNPRIGDPRIGPSVLYEDGRTPGYILY